MPQLDLAPWVLYLLYSWMILLVVLTPKILGHTFPNEPTTQSAKKPETQSWAWPWS
uniref:ATP synthase complex subunit 8 n=1 Tax=Amia calva TaxID=7924 RepID=Q8HQL7_AMICA|nr:ATP synthase F0 subunit 8 [Amia calva]AAR16094.1 ATPase8 [Amia calva]BAB40746.1 ATPase subunits 8 [Amia calva]